MKSCKTRSPRSCRSLPSAFDERGLWFDDSLNFHDDWFSRFVWERSVPPRLVPHEAWMTVRFSNRVDVTSLIIQTYLFLCACAVNHLYSQSDPTKMFYGEHVLAIGVAKRA